MIVSMTVDNDMFVKGPVMTVREDMRMQMRMVFHERFLLCKCNCQSPRPEKTPLRITISYVLLEDMRRVQLFSEPRQTVACRTNGIPYENRKLSLSSEDRSALTA